MSRLIFVPQLPTPMRYQEWWFEFFPLYFREYYNEVVVLRGLEKTKDWEKQVNRPSPLFAPVYSSIVHELLQIKEYLSLELKKNDTLFLSDLSFPGFFSCVLHHKRPKKTFAFCHATSKNRYDYFQPVRRSKWRMETGSAKLFDKVFVSTNYHKEKLGWPNIEVVGLPRPPFRTYREPKLFNIVSVARPSVQKVNKKLEKHIEAQFGKIIRPNVTTWPQYYKFLSAAKILLVTSKEDTFNYSVMEAILNKTIPVVPNDFCFPELLNRNYRYDNEEELVEILERYLKHPDRVPKLLNRKLVKNFFKEVTNIMKGE